MNSKTIQNFFTGRAFWFVIVVLYVAFALLICCSCRTSKHQVNPADFRYNKEVINKNRYFTKL